MTLRKIRILRSAVRHVSKDARTALRLELRHRARCRWVAPAAPTA
jgi:hypothetical protein